MTLEQLRYFQAAARLQHMGKAALQENISQPSLSIAIKKLETEFGVPLFKPNGRGVELTSQGKAFLPYADSILLQAQQAKKQMNACADSFNGEIRVAYTASMAYGYIPRLFKNFLSQIGKAYVIYSDEMPSDDIAAGLKSGRFDLGISSKIKPEPELIQIPLLYQPLVVLLPDTKAFAQCSLDRLEDLCAYPFVSYRKDYPMYRQISALFQREGLTPAITHFAYSEDAIARLVEQELGISIVAQTESLSQYRVRTIRPNWLKEGRHIYLTFHRLRVQGEGVKKMKDFLKIFTEQFPTP